MLCFCQFDVILGSVCFVCWSCEYFIVLLICFVVDLVNILMLLYFGFTFPLPCLFFRIPCVQFLSFLLMLSIHTCFLYSLSSAVTTRYIIPCLSPGPHSVFTQSFCLSPCQFPLSALCLFFSMFVFFDASYFVLFYFYYE